MSKKSLKNLKSITGQIVTENLTELEKSNRIQAHKVSLAYQYEDKLGRMELSDLQVLASDMGIVPIDNRDSLIKLIKKEFKKI